MKLSKKISLASLTTLTFFSAVITAFAQDTTQESSRSGITNPVIGNLGNNLEGAQTGSLATSYFINIWNTIISIGGLTVIIMFIWGALEWITAGGDSSKIEKARNRILQSIIGLIILVSSFVILGFISQIFFGEEFSLLNLTFNRATNIDGNPPQ